MKVLEVEPVAINLLKARTIELTRAQLIFDHEHYAALKDDQVGSMPHARNQKLKEEVGMRKLTDQLPKVRDLILPSGTLRRLHSERELTRELPKQLGIACAKKTC